MIEEYQSIMKNDVWDVIQRPEGKSIVSSNWIYKIKHATDNNVEKYEARFGYDALFLRYRGVVEFR